MSAELKTARKILKNRFGTSLEAKSSDTFALAFGVPEGFTESQESQSIIVELSSDDVVQPPVEEITRILMEGFPAIPEPSSSSAVTESLRRLATASIRSARKASLSPVFDVFQPGLEAGPEVDVCWLNQTARIRVASLDQASALADHSGVEAFDIPRFLTPEIDATADLVGANSYRLEHTVDGKGIVVAVIDSEVDISHPGLVGRVVHKKNFITEPWGNPGAHGTAVAGIIGSKHPTFMGMAPGCQIFSYKVLNKLGGLSGDDFDGAMAIQAALEDGARIANCSWGAGKVTGVLSREAKACNAAWALGLTVVKSAGNKGPGKGTLTTPADADGIIVVGGTDRTGLSVPSYSSRGPTPDGRKRPHLCAPGGSPSVGIRSCLLNGAFGSVGFGTSFAAPHVSGLLALLAQRFPAHEPEDLRQILLNGVKPFPNNDANTHGAGFVQLL